MPLLLIVTFTVTACPVASNTTTTASITEDQTKALVATPSGGTWSVVSGGGTISGTTYTPANVTSNTSVTVRYTIAASGGCNASTSDVTFTVTACPVASNTTTAASITEDQTKALVATPSGGTWSVVSGGGTISGTTYTPANVTSNTSVTVRYTIAASGGCNASTSDRTFTVTACPVASNTTTTASITEDQTKALVAAPSGGTWSVVSGGGTISGTTYTPANVTSNTNVTVRYTIAASGGCNASTSDVTFTVTACPVASNTTTTASITEDQTKALVATPTGGTWSVVSGGGTISGTTYTPANVTSNTNVTVRYTIAASGGCNASTSDRTFTVTACPVASNTTSTASITENQTKALVATPTGGTWSVVSGGGTISGTTYTPANVTSNTSVTVRYTIAASGGCNASTSDRTFTVTACPVASNTTTTASITEDQTKALVATPSGGTWSVVSGGGTISGTTYTPANVTSNTSVTVRYTIAASGGCNASTSDVTFTVTACPVASNTTTTASITEDQTKALVATPSGGTWSVVSGGGTISGTTYTPANVTSNTSVTVRYTIAASGGCNASTSDVTFTVTACPVASNTTTTASITEDQTKALVATPSGGTWSVVSGGGTISGTTYTPANVTSNTSVTVRYTIAASGGCNASTSDVTFTVTACPVASNTTTTASITEDQTKALVATPSGGTWSVVSGGGTISGTTYTPANVTSNTSVTVRYTIAASGGCNASTSDVTFTVTACPVASNTTTTASITEDQTKALVATPSGGTWSVVSGGGTISGTTYTPANVTSNTNVTVRYTIAASGGCNASTSDVTFTVTACPVASNTTTTASITEDQTKALVATPSGGTWSVVSGGGTISGNTYTPANVTSNTSVTVRYTIAASGGCNASTSDVTFTVTACPVASNTTTAASITEDQTKALVATPSGGTWSVVSGGGTISGTTYTPANVTSNTSVTVRYTIAASGGCNASTSDVTFTVTACPVASNTTTAASITEDQTKALVATPSGGTWSVVSGGGTISGTTYTPANVTSNTNVTVRYTIAASGGCNASTSDVTFTVTACPVASNTTTTASITEDQTKALVATPSGGTWSVVSGGGTISGTTYTPANVTSNTSVTVRYTIAASGGCNASTSDVTFTVTACPVASNTTTTASITEDQTKALVATPSGGTWSVVSGGGTISGTTYTPANVTSNTNVTVRYTIAASGGCNASTSDVTFTVTACPVASNTTTTASITEDQTKALVATPSGGTWSVVSGGGTISGTTYTPANVTSNTNVTVRYTIAASGGCSASTSDRTFTVTACPVASNTTSTASITENQTKALVATPTGGTWSVVSGGGTISGTTYNPANVTSNTNVTVRYTIAASGGCNASTSDVTFTVLPDTDGDGIADVNDLDADNDGIPDADETNGNDPYGDEDGDGIPNWLDTTDNGSGGDGSTTNYTDTDGNGIPDVYDTDGDGIPNHVDLDSDNDGIPDIVEAGGTDANGDGLVDGVFADTDGDGLANVFDTDNGGTPLAVADTDGDGTPNFLDLDSDGDGIIDLIESQATTATPIVPVGVDTDEDGIDDAFDVDCATCGGVTGVAIVPVNTDGADAPDYLDTDSDNDGILDLVEAWDTDGDYIANTTPTGLDSDGDGIDNAFDSFAGIDPIDGPTNNGQTANNFPNTQGGTSERDWREAPDTDGDGIADVDDLDADNDGIPDADETNGNDPYGDEDGDGIPNWLDTTDNGSGGDGSTTNYTDTDGNGIPDVYDTDGDGIPNHVDLDSDNDGIPDIVEAGGTDANGDGLVDGVFADTDGDGLANVFDTDNGGTPLAVADTDGDGTPNFLDLDSDGDGIIDLIESQATTATPIVPVGVDTDEDGIDDAFDVDCATCGGVTGVAIVPVNTDGTDAPDYLDTDSDNDGILDLVEAWDTDGDYIANTTPTGLDSDGDGIDNAFDSFAGIDPIDGPTNNGQTANNFPNTQGGTSERDWREQQDTDGDGIADVDDLDADNDGILNTDECSSTIAPTYSPTPSNGDLTASFEYSNGITGLMSTTPPTSGSFVANRPGYSTGADHIRIVRGGGLGAVTTVVFNEPANPYISVSDVSLNGAFIENQRLEGFLYGIPVPFTVGTITNNGSVSGNDLIGGVSGVSQAGFLNILFDVPVDEIRLTSIGSGGDFVIFDIGSIPSCDTDGDGIPNHVDLDSDNDGIPDIIEAGGTDANGDGLVDGVFADTDGDGLANVFDTDNGGTPLAVADTDGDGTPNFLDLDSDGDGIIDLIESQATTATPIVPVGVDTDEDGIDDAFDVDCATCGGVTGVAIVPVNTDGADAPDYLDTDSDNDGILDLVEAWDTDGDYIANTTPTGLDSDGDGIDNAFDSFAGIDPIDGPTNNGQTANNFPNTQGGTSERDWREAPDTDGDGIADVDDLDADNDGIPDADETNGNDPYGDEDGDGIPNWLDTTDNGSGGDGSTTNYTDTDGNGIPDVYDTDGDGIPNHVDLDSDNDGIPDIIEAGGTDANGDGLVDGVFADTDGDGLANVFDTDNGGTPLAVADTDGDGTPNFLDLDSDGDGIIDLIESQATTATPIVPVGVDTDEDGIDDAFDVDCATCGGVTGVAIVPVNTDGADAPDYLDTDSDNDGILDLVEAWDTDGDYIANTTPTGLDSDGDGIDNAFDSFAGIDPIDGPTNNGQTANNFPNTQGGTSERDWREAPDTDGDGIADVDDLDADNDGIPDADETNGNDPYGDEDGDGIPNWLDTTDNGSGGDGSTTNYTDTDGNGIPDVYDTDGDGIPNHVDLDSDNDGIPDIVEAGGTDANGDGLVDGVFADTDGDGLANVFDTDNGGTPLAVADTDGDGTPNFLDLDSDGDGIIDLIESQATTATPIVPVGVDTDEDGIDDAFDVDCATCGGVTGVAIVPVNTDGADAPDYLDTDSDNDGILDLVEAWDTDGDYIANTTPTGLDSDGDGIDNAFDSFAGIDPIDGPTNNGQTANNFPNTQGGTSERDWREAPDTDGDGIADVDDLDADNDGIPDADETNGNDPYGDEDGDGIPNWLDTTDNGSGGDGSTTNYTDTDGNGIPDVYDTDGDGIPNHVDLDSDNDGIPDIVEAGGTDANGDGLVDGVFADTDGDGLANVFDTDNGGTPLAVADTDGDGTPNFLDLDSDGDGIIDLIESQATTATPIVPVGVDTDEDGIDDAFDVDCATCGGVTGVAIVPVNTDGTDAPDYLDTDSDNDGILDLVEAWDTDGDYIANTTPTGLDSDGDGIDNAFDSFAGIDPIDGPTNNGQTANNFPNTQGGTSERDWREAPDTDGDGIADVDDLDADNDGIPDADETNGNDPYGDEDGDGIPNWLDTTDNGSGGDGSTTNYNDTDGNGIPDVYDTDGDGIPNHVDLDSDNDGIPDIVEAGGTDANGDGLVDGVFADTDGDGLANVFDTDNGGTPLAVADTDGDGTPNFLDLDSDGDGIIDLIESQATTATPIVPLGVDTDEDGIDDAFDVDCATCGGVTGVAIVPVNTDGADAPDYLDTDSDNDGENDIIEAWDTNGDGIAETTPTGVDSDGDGIDNAFDDFAGINPIDGPTNNGQTANDLSDADGGSSERDWREVPCDSGVATLAPNNATTSATDACTKNGWTYYYDPVNPTQLLFAIEHKPVGGNTNDFSASISITVSNDPTTNNGIYSNSDEVNGNATFVMGRYWNATINSGSLNGFVNIRFFFNQDEIDIVADTAIAWKNEFGSSTETSGLSWFAMNSGNFNASVPTLTTTGINNSSAVFPNATDTEDGVAYAQFQTTSLTGGSIGFVIGTNSVVLPIELISFDVYPLKNIEVRCEWLTATEINNDYFTLYRRSNSTEWSKLATLPGAGTTNDTSSYYFIDYQPLIGVSYYMLEQTDFDGTTVMVGMNQVTNIYEEHNEVQVVPNPSLDKFWIKGVNLDITPNILVYDKFGKLAYSVENHLISEPIDLSSMSSGVYYLQIQIDQAVVSKKIVKL